MIFPSNLKVAALRSSKYFGLIRAFNTSRVYGADGNLLNYLAEALNFQYEVVLPIDGEWGSIKNGSWTGIIGMVNRTDADMGISYMAVTEERFKAVDFIYPYATLDRTFVVKDPGPLPILDAYIYPFSKNVWILYILLIISATIVFQKVMFKNVSFLDSFIAILGTVLLQPADCSDEKKLSDWKRVVFGLWLTIATVMPFLYTTSFLSFITMPGKEPGIRDFRDLSKAVLSKNFKCLAPKGTADLDLLLKSNMNHLKILGETIKINNWVYRHDEKLEDLIDDSTGLIMVRQLIRLVFDDHIYTDKMVSEDSFGVWNVAIALRKNFCCKKQLDAIMFRLLSAGLYKKWFDDEVFESNLQRKLNRKYVEHEISLSFEDLKSSIFILITGFSLSFVVLLSEIFSVNRFYERILKTFWDRKEKVIIFMQ